MTVVVAVAASAERLLNLKFIIFKIKIVTDFDKKKNDIEIDLL